MNHINRLTATNETLTAKVIALEEGLADLRAYLLSSKFSNEGPLKDLVNVADVLRRIEGVKDSATEVEASNAISPCTIDILRESGSERLTTQTYYGAIHAAEKALKKSGSIKAVILRDGEVAQVLFPE